MPYEAVINNSHNPIFVKVPDRSPAPVPVIAERAYLYPVYIIITAPATIPSCTRNLIRYAI